MSATGSSNDQVLLSIEEPHLRRRTAALLEAQESLSRLRAEGMLAEQESLHLLDERFGMEPEIRRVVRAILAKTTRAATRVHGAAETLDECLRAFTSMTLSMLRLLMETGKADNLLAKQKLDKNEAEAAAAWQKIQDERSTERVNAKLENQALQASLKAVLRESAVLVCAFREEVAEMEKKHQRDSHEVRPLACTRNPCRKCLPFSLAHPVNTQCNLGLTLIVFPPPLPPQSTVQLESLQEASVNKMWDLAAAHTKELQRMHAAQRREMEAKEKLEKILDSATVIPALLLARKHLTCS